MSLIWAALFFPINDITTTPEKAPVYMEIAKLDANKDRDLTYDIGLRERQRKLYPDLDAVRTPKSANTMFERIKALAKDQKGWKIINADDANFRLEITATTELLKFADDVVIEVRPEPDGSTVHMRSKSRIGRSDLGANYKRIKKFLSLL